MSPDGLQASIEKMRSAGAEIDADQVAMPPPATCWSK